MSLLANDPNQQSNNYTTIVDEVWIAREYSHLMFALREALGISENASYLIIDADNVLILDTLMQEIDTKGFSRREIDKFKTLALELAPSQYVTPYQAIVAGIMPINYEVIELNGAYRIQHAIFKLVLPQIYSTKEELNQALATLLIEKTPRGGQQSDFVFMDASHNFETIIEELRIKEQQNGLNIIEAIITSLQVTDENLNSAKKFYTQNSRSYIENESRRPCCVNQMF